MKKLFFYFFTASILLSVLVLFYFFKYTDNKLHVVICDVGQGDGIFITTPNRAQILIDGGPDKAVLDCLSSNMPFWDRSIDAIILTHPHADHFTGLIDVIDRYEVQSFYAEDVPSESEIYGILEAKLADKDLSAKDLHRLESFTEKSGLRIQTLWPSLDTLEKTDQNNANLDLNGLSVVTLITFGNFSALFTGDAGKEVMDLLAADIGHIDLLKVPHHGSRTGMSDYFLNSTMPELAVISVGKENRYGHPAKFSLDILKNHGVKVLRTDVNGQVDILSDGYTWSAVSKR